MEGLLLNLIQAAVFDFGAWREFNFLGEAVLNFQHGGAQVALFEVGSNRGEGAEIFPADFGLALEHFDFGDARQGNRGSGGGR